MNYSQNHSMTTFETFFYNLESPEKEKNDHLISWDSSESLRQSTV